MRKREIPPAPSDRTIPDRAWLDVEELAQVEVTSEDRQHPIEGALVSHAESGWRPARPGAQTIRLIFDRPQRLSRMRLLFTETDVARTQEFVLRWSADGGRTFREILRQQWNFAPPETTREVEDYRVDLDGVAVLELTIVPDQSGGQARASLAQWRLA